VADDVGLLTQEIEIELRDVGPPRNFFRRLGRDDRPARLRPGERDLDLDVTRDEREVGEHLAHALGAEGIAEQDRVEHRGRCGECGHEVFLAWPASPSYYRRPVTS